MQHRPFHPHPHSQWTKQVTNALYLPLVIYEYTYVPFSPFLHSRAPALCWLGERYLASKGRECAAVNCVLTARVQEVSRERQRSVGRYSEQPVDAQGSWQGFRAGISTYCHARDFTTHSHITPPPLSIAFPSPSPSSFKTRIASLIGCATTTLTMRSILLFPLDVTPGTRRCFFTHGGGQDVTNRKILQRSNIGSVRGGEDSTVSTVDKISRS